MEKVATIAFLVVLIFCLAKFLEMKYLEKEWKPLKNLVRDAIIVFSSTSIGAYIYFHMDGSMKDFLNIVTENKSLNVAAPQIFTDEPGF
jgi:hypothetical protein